MPKYDEMKQINISLSVKHHEDLKDYLMYWVG
jgi:hypothetical protein